MIASMLRCVEVLSLSICDYYVSASYAGMVLLVILYIELWRSQQFLNSGMSVCLHISLSVFLFVTSSMLVQLYSSYQAQFIQELI